MSALFDDKKPAPRLVALLGWLGLIPFLCPPLVALVAPGLADGAAIVLVAYGALILSFLGGARWGITIRADRPDGLTVTLAMLPTLVALGLVAIPSLPDHWRMSGLAIALIVHWFWDRSAAQVPPWYPSLRLQLTTGAVAGLVLGLLTLNGS